MNYYYRYLGDYAKDTLHLTLMQTGAYNLLLDRYYAEERGIPTDEVYQTCRAYTKPERAAVKKVLAQFFTKCGNSWVNAKCEKEIQKARKRIEIARQNGAKNRPSGIPAGLPGGGSIQSLNLQSSISKNSEAQKAPSGIQKLREAIADSDVCKVIKESRR